MEVNSYAWWGFHNLAAAAFVSALRVSSLSKFQSVLRPSEASCELSQCHRGII